MCIEINKITKTIKQYGSANKLLCKDVTRECIQVESEYTMSDSANDKSYPLSLVCVKIMNSTVDERCMKMLHAFNRVLLP